MPRYSRVLYHQKGTRTHVSLKVTFMSRKFCRRTYPFCDTAGRSELNCPMFSDRTGCKYCQRAELLEVSGEKPCMRDQGTSGAHGPHMLRCRTYLSHLRAAVPRIFLTTPLSSVPVGFPSGPSERRLRCGTRALR